MEDKTMSPLQSLTWVDRTTLKPNDYNPNKVAKDNLELLTQSIFANGWTLPIVARPNMTIIDGFHRWTVSGPDWKMKHPTTKKTLYETLNGKVPVVFVDHQDESANIFGTITHNRARGTHLLSPMKVIVKKLLEAGKTVKEITLETGMEEEEVYRLSDFSKDDFLNLMIQKDKQYSKGEFITKI